MTQYILKILETQHCSLRTNSYFDWKKELVVEVAVEDREGATVHHVSSNDFDDAINQMDSFLKSCGEGN